MQPSLVRRVVSGGFVAFSVLIAARPTAVAQARGPRWHLELVRAWPGPPRLFAAPEDQDGDVPMPPGTRWRCRYEAAHRLSSGPRTWIDRGLTCSSDGWQTNVQRAATCVVTNGAFSPGQGDLYLAEKTADGERSFTVILRYE